MSNTPSSPKPLDALLEDEIRRALAESRRQDYAGPMLEAHSRGILALAQALATLRNAERRG